MLKELREIFNLSDIIVAALMIIIISLMVIPIPTSALDVLMVIKSLVQQVQHDQQVVQQTY